jgi:integrase/recombinase XerD
MTEKSENTAIVVAPDREAYAPALFVPTEKAARRFLEFFTAQIRNANTRRAYGQAVYRFAAWCGRNGISELSHVQPFHVAAFIEEFGQDLSPPTVKQNLAALRMLFDWLVTGQIIESNPAHVVRGPRYVLKKGKTPVLSVEEAHTLLQSIPTEKKAGAEDPNPEADLLGLRDRALIATMVYSFARVGAVTKMKVSDYFIQGRRRWIRLHEKGGKEHDVPCHHSLEEYLHEYANRAGILDDLGGYLFRSAAGKTGQLTDKPLSQPDAYRIVQRRAKVAGIETKIGNHSFRATGITAYLKNSGKLEVARQIAAHESPRTTKLYDRRSDEISLDEIERIVI